MGIEKAHLAQFAFLTLRGILRKIVVWKNLNTKACEPATKMIFIGILFDSVKMSLEVTPERLQEIRTLVSAWLRKSNATKKEVQSLIGKLSFV